MQIHTQFEPFAFYGLLLRSVALLSRIFVPHSSSYNVAGVLLFNFSNNIHSQKKHKLQSSWSPYIPYQKNIMNTFEILVICFKLSPKKAAANNGLPQSISTSLANFTRKLPKNFEWSAQKRQNQTIFLPLLKHLLPFNLAWSWLLVSRYQTKEINPNIQFQYWILSHGRKLLFDSKVLTDSSNLMNQIPFDPTFKSKPQFNTHCKLCPNFNH